MTIEVRWNNAARVGIAPRTIADVKLVRDWWQLTEWNHIYKSFSGTSGTTPDADLAEPLARVLAAEVAPRELTPIEMEIVFALVGSNRASEYMAKNFGAEKVAPLLAAPTLVSERDPTGIVLRRKRSAANGKSLRRILLQEDAKTRAACRAAVQAAWDEGDAAVHEQLAYAFFDDDAWREQVLAEIASTAPKLDAIHLTFPRDEASMRALLARREKTDALAYPEIVASLGTAALGILLELAPEVRGSTAHRSHTLAMSVIVDGAVAKHLAGCLSHPSTRDIIGNYFERHVELAKEALPHASQGASRNAALVKALMLKVCGAASSPEIGVAIEDPALPNVLRDAPWRSPPPALPNLGLDLASRPKNISLSAAQIASGLAYIKNARKDLPDMDEAETAAYRDLIKTQTYIWAWINGTKAVPLSFQLELFLEGRLTTTAVLPMLAQFGIVALPGVIKTPSAYSQMKSNVRDAIDDADMAFTIAQLLIDSEREGNREMATWFVAQPRAAAFGLLAVAHDSDKHMIAEMMLRRLARAGHAELILEIARTTPHEAAVRALLERDAHLDVLPAQPAPRGHGRRGEMKLDSITRPRLRDGRVLGEEAMKRIIEMLAFSPADDPYVGLVDVKRACEPRSLAEMAWDLAALADAGGRRSYARNFPDWMRWSLRFFSDDEVIRRITPALKHPTVYSVLEALAIDGERAAVIELATAHERGDTTESLARVARAQRSTVDELVEAMLPTTHLEEEGTTTLAYGSRMLRVGFDTTLAPILFIADKRIASLPRAKPDDDALAIRLAKEHWEELKEDVRAIAHLRGRALENAMRTGRKISARQFLAGWANHPLGKHQARGVVFALDREPLVTFRVAEDSTLANADDETLVLADSDNVRVPHPAELGAAELDRWSRILNDYGLLQPIAQLARTPLALAPGEMEATTLARDVTSPLTMKAFQRVVGEQGLRLARPLVRGSGTVGITAQTKWTDRKYLVTKVMLEFRDDKEKIPLAKIDPIELAEALFVMRLALEAVD